MHKIILKWATRVALSLGVAWAGTLALIDYYTPEVEEAAPHPFIPAAGEEQLYDDLYLEYCAYPATEETLEVHLVSGEVVYDDPDSCLMEIPEDQIFVIPSP